MKGVSHTGRDGDGRTEDGAIATCAVCELVLHLNDDDEGICPDCATEGWSWTQAHLVRRGDIVILHRPTEVVATEDYGSAGVMVYGPDERIRMFRQTDRVAVRSR